MEQNEKPSSIDEIFKDYKGSDHVEEVDWGKDVGNEIIPDDTDWICSFEIDEDTKDKVMAAAAKYGMTFDEYFNASIKYMAEHKEETKEETTAKRRNNSKNKRKKQKQKEAAKSQRKKQKAHGRNTRKRQEGQSKKHM